MLSVRLGEGPLSPSEPSLPWAQLGLTAHRAHVDLEGTADFLGNGRSFLLSGNVSYAGVGSNGPLDFSSGSLLDHRDDPSIGFI